MNPQEQTRLHVLNTVWEHQLPTAQAAELLGVSERHAWRLLAAYRKDGAAALSHGNRGRPSHNAVSDAEAAAEVQTGLADCHEGCLFQDRFSSSTHISAPEPACTPTGVMWS